MTDFTPLAACLACGGSSLHTYADLGMQPLANDFHVGRDPGEVFPLGLRVCFDCWHSQQIGVVDPDRIYRDYPYASGTSESLRHYFHEFAYKVEGDFEIDRNDPDDVLTVLDIASNDGSLLTCFSEFGHHVQGVDPSQLAKKAIKAGIPTIHDYWCEPSSIDALAAHPGGYNVVVAMNVLGHVDDPLEFLRLCKSVLASGGRIYIQTSQAHMLRNAEFDTVYHEHISFFTARSFLALASRAGLAVDAISYAPVHGTSYVVELVDRQTQAGDDSFPILLDERLFGLYNDGVYQGFAARMNELIDHAASTLDLARREGFRLVGYGAAAKGMTFLNASGIELDFVVDDAPLKIGKYCPGSRIPVVGPSDARVNDQRPFFWLILAWNMRDEIVQRIKMRRSGPTGDRFMVCFPKVMVTAE